MPTWPSPIDQRLGTPDTPAIRSTRAVDFVASLVRFRYGLPGCSPPCTDRTGTPQPSGTFTSRLSTDRSPSPPLDITTTATGLLCWRDSHPLEWQLASLHGHFRPDRASSKSRYVGCAPESGSEIRVLASAAMVLCGLMVPPRDAAQETTQTDARAHLIDTIPVSIECFEPRGF